MPCTDLARMITAEKAELAMACVGGNVSCGNALACCAPALCLEVMDGASSYLPLNVQRKNVKVGIGYWSGHY